MRTPAISSTPDVASRRVPLPVLEEVAQHLGEVRRRQFGYAFGGPDQSWCYARPEQAAGIALKVNPKDPGSAESTFTGCFKYATCELIPADAKWKPWEHLTEDQRMALRSVRCYRATSDGWD